MFAIRTAAFAAALTLTAFAAPAQAMPVANLGAATHVEKAAFVFSDQLVPGRPSRLDQFAFDAAQSAAESYFDYDAMITFGALALAGATFAAFATAAARRKAEMEAAAERASWHRAAFRAVEAELADFAATYRRAA